MLIFRRRISDLIHQVHGRNYHRQKKQNDPNYPSTKDEEDAKKIIEVQDKVMDDVAGEFCLDEADGKARCSISYCKKLFKNKEFLKKHIKAKHPELALEKMVRVAEPYMRERYEKEHILQRNLPNIAIETKDGVELRQFKDVFEPANAMLLMGSSFVPPGFIPPPPPFRRPSFDRQSFERRDRPHRDRRPLPPPPPRQTAPSSMVDESGHKRSIVSYADVDAPQVILLLFYVRAPQIKSVLQYTTDCITLRLWNSIMLIVIVLIPISTHYCIDLLLMKPVLYCSIASIVCVDATAHMCRPVQLS